MKRQQRIDPYIVDYVCFEAGLIVDADGSQHIGSAYDEARDAHLRAQGFRVLRFYNNDILARRESVLTSTLTELAPAAASSPASRIPSPLPSPARGEGVEGTYRG